MVKIDGNVLKVRLITTEPPEPLFDAFLMVALALAFWALDAWMLMFGMAGAHRVWPEIPAAGYWACLLICVGLHGISSRLQRGSHSY